MHNTERKSSAAVSWLKNNKGKSKPYEVRYRLLSKDIPLVGKSGRGELFAVLDGIGSAPLGIAAAQAVADALLRFYREKDTFTPESSSLLCLLQETNMAINRWGFVEGTDRPGD